MQKWDLEAWSTSTEIYKLDILLTEHIGMSGQIRTIILNHDMNPLILQFEANV